MSTPSITNADETKIVSLLAAAERRWLYMAPGVTQPIAEAIGKAWAQLGVNAGSVILDVDPEVYRLGYGTPEGLETLQRLANEHRTLICRHQDGVRIGLVISDDRTLIFTPTPLLIEAGSNRTDHPNAIELNAVPPSVARDVGLGPEGAAEQQVGIHTVKPQDIEKTRADLIKNPPLKFHIAQKVRVFNSQLEFVEFEMQGCFVSQHTANIPPSLMGLAGDAATRDRLRSSFSVIGKQDVSDRKKGLSEEGLRTERARITRKYLRSVTGFGILMRRDLKDDFEKDVTGLRDRVAAFKKLLLKKLGKVIETNAKALSKALFPSVKRRMPEHWTGSIGAKPSSAVLRDFLQKEILNAFGTPEQFVNDMAVTVNFKGVTYETLSNPKFTAAAQKHFPDLTILHEFDAAQGKNPGRANPKQTGSEH